MQELDIIYAQNDSLFDGVISLLPNPVIIDVVEDNEPSTIYCNKKFVDLIGYTSEEINLHKKAYHHYFNKIRENIFREDSENLETKIWIKCKDGKKRLFLVTSNLWKENIVISLLTDVTDKELFLELEKLSKLKDRLISIMAHDIRNPLATLQGLLDILDENSLSPSQFKEMIPAVSQQIDQVRHLLDNLLNWVKSQLNKNTPKPQILSVKEIIQNVHELFIQDFKHKNIEFSFVMKEEMNVFADKDMLELTLRNLLSNAIKFTHHGGCINILVEPSDKFVQICIQDNGIGLSKEKINKILSGELVSHTGTNKEIGTGLGLNLCLEFIKLNNGFMNINSTEGKGSEFVLLIPNKEP